MPNMSKSGHTPATWVGKGFSNRDITILSMNKTQKYLRY